MAPLHSGSVGNPIERAGSPVDEVLIEMEARTDREGFPTVGPEVGRTLALCTRLTSARSDNDELRTETPRDISSRHCSYRRAYRSTRLMLLYRRYYTEIMEVEANS